MNNFFESEYCKSLKHCKACRLSSSFRKTMNKKFAVGENYDCPKGITADHFKEGHLPPILKQAEELTKSIKKVGNQLIKGETVKVSVNERNRRLHICHECDIFEKATNRCRKCGCYVDWKTSLETENCPINKW